MHAGFSKVPYSICGWSCKISGARLARVVGIHTSELIPMRVEIPVPRPVTILAIVQSVVVVNLVHHPCVAVRAGLSSQILRDKDYTTFRGQVVADHRDRARRTALDSWTPARIADEENFVSSDQLER